MNIGLVRAQRLSMNVVMAGWVRMLLVSFRGRFRRSLTRVRFLGSSSTRNL